MGTGLEPTRTNAGVATSHKAPVRFYSRIVVEWGVCLLLAALFIETWLVEGMVVPCRVVGDSMADTLLGEHQDVVCTDCGYPFPCGVDQLRRPSRAVCPNCGFADNDIRVLTNLQGERLWIDRTAFLLRPPRRWEVVALRQPGQADKIAVKRIVGLPGETVEIRGGDVYADGQIQRKDLIQQRALAVPVYDAAYRPTRAPMTPSRWQAERPGSRWESSGGRFTHPPGPGDEPIDWLVYHHRRRTSAGTVPGTIPGWVETPVSDVCGYNQSRPRREEDIHAVADLMLAFRMTVEHPRVNLPGAKSERGSFYIRATDGGERFEARLRFDGERPRYEVFQGREANLAADGDMPTAALRRLVEVSLIDRQFLLALDGRTIVRLAFQESGPSPSPVSTPLAIGVQGLGVTIDGLRIYRDVYYTRPIGLFPQRSLPQPARLCKDEYFVLGDNSPVSEDSRYWPNSGAIGSEMFVGKPLGLLSWP